MKRLSALAASATVLTLALTSTGCSNATKDYATPKELCGVKVNPNILSPLLPAGERVSSHPTSTDDWTKRCRIQVDEETSLSVTVEWWEKDAKIDDVALDALAISERDERAGNGKFIYSETGSVGLVTCPEQREDGKNLFASARVTHEVKKSEMKRFIMDYTNSVAESKECQAGQ